MFCFVLFSFLLFSFDLEYSPGNSCGAVWRLHMGRSVLCGICLKVKDNDEEDMLICKNIRCRGVWCMSHMDDGDLESNTDDDGHFLCEGCLQLFNHKTINCETNKKITCRFHDYDEDYHYFHQIHYFQLKIHLYNHQHHFVLKKKQIYLFLLYLHVLQKFHFVLILIIIIMIINI